MSGIDVDAFDAFEREAWETRVQGYRSFFAAVTSRVVEPLLDAAGVRAGTRVLDVGSGPGQVAAAAAARGAEAVGVDVAEAMVACARELHPELEFVRADAARLPFGDGRFDAVAGNFALPHFGDPEAVVAELVRVLRPGGRLALTTWDAPDRMRIMGIYLEAFAATGARAPAGLPAGPDVFGFADPVQFSRLLTERGLADVEVSTVAFSHPVADIDELWDALLRGTVRMAALTLGQPETVRQSIRRELEQRLAEHRSGTSHDVPVSVKLAAGLMPA